MNKIRNNKEFRELLKSLDETKSVDLKYSSFKDKVSLILATRGLLKRAYKNAYMNFINSSIDTGSARYDYLYTVGFILGNPKTSYIMHSQQMTQRGRGGITFNECFGGITGMSDPHFEALKQEEDPSISAYFLLGRVPYQRKVIYKYINYLKNDLKLDINIEEFEFNKRYHESEISSNAKQFQEFYERHYKINFGSTVKYHLESTQSLRTKVLRLHFDTRKYKNLMEIKEVLFLFRGMYDPTMSLMTALAYREFQESGIYRPLWWLGLQGTFYDNLTPGRSYPMPSNYFIYGGYKEFKKILDLIISKAPTKSKNYLWKSMYCATGRALINKFRSPSHSSDVLDYIKDLTFGEVANKLLTDFKEYYNNDFDKIFKVVKEYYPGHCFN